MGKKKRKKETVFFENGNNNDSKREEDSAVPVAVPNLVSTQNSPMHYYVFKIVSPPEYTLDCDLRNVIIKPIRETKTCKDKSPQCHLRPNVCQQDRTYVFY